jgi:signal transduction histidine kinase/CheY-like chemotaxis protein
MADDSRRVRYRATLLAFALAAAPPAAFAAQGLHTETVDEQDGLVGGAVTGMTQTADGRMWFVGRGQVCAWDGRAWEYAGPGEELPADFAGTWIVADGNRIVTAGWRLRGGMMVHEGGTWRALDLEPLENEDLDTPMTGFELVSGPSGRQLAFSLGARLRLLDLDSWTWSSAEPAGAPGTPITALEATGSELLVLRGTALERLAPGADRLEPFLDLAGSGIDPLTLHAERSPDGLSRLWVLGSKGLAWIEDGALHLHPTPLPEVWSAELQTPRLQSDGHGHLLIGSRSVVLLLDQATGAIRQLHPDDGLASHGATSLLLDRDHNLWVGSLRGVTRIPPQRFEVWTSRQGLHEDEVTAIAELAGGRLVLGHHGTLTVIEEGAKPLRVPLPDGRSTSPLMSRVLELEPDGRGGLWIAASGLGLLHLDPELEVRQVPLPTNPCNSVSLGPDGSLAVGTSGGVHLAPTGGTDAFTTTTLEHSVRRVEHATDGTLYACLPGRELHRLRPGAAGWDTLEVRGDSRHRNIFAVHEGPGGRLWVGSHGGLLELVGDRVVQPEDVPHLDLPVYSILEQADGTLWLGTAAGLARWHQSALTWYEGAHGLAGREANRDALHLDGRGRLWVGTDGGASTFLGEPVHPRRPLEVELVTFERGPVTHGTDAHRRDLEARFRVVTFAGDRRVTFRARLDGYDEEWLPEQPLESGLLRYTNLPEGEYALELQARAAESEWGPVTRSAPLAIVPALWERPWFQGLLGVLGALAAVAGIGYLRASRRTQVLEVEVDRGHAALEESALRYREMFQNNPAIQLLLDPDTGRVLEANAAAVDYFGNDPDEIRELTLADLTGIGDADLLAGLESLRSEHEWICRPSEEDPLYGVPIEIRSSQFVLRGEPIVQVTIYDIERRQRLEQQLLEASRLRAVGELARGVAHDFNNLLTAILGHNELIDMEIVGDDSIASHVHNIREAGERGAKLVQQLLAFGRKHEVHLEELDLNGVVRGTIPILESALGSRYRVELDLDPGVGRIHADRNQVQRVLMNLALHARDAMSGGGAVRVQTRFVEALEVPLHGEELDPAHCYCSLSVQDLGPEDEALPPRESGSGERESLGLNLTLVRSLVESCDGQLVIYHAPDDRLVVQAYFVAAEHGAADLFKGRTDADEEEASDLTVFLVEDNEPVRITIAALLRSSGHRVLEAGSVAQARALFSEHAEDIDLLLADLQLGDGNGKELARELRARSEDLRVAFMSGAYDEALGDAGEIFIHKPFTLAKLQRALGQATSS